MVGGRSRRSDHDPGRSRNPVSAPPAGRGLTDRARRRAGGAPGAAGAAVATCHRAGAPGPRCRAAAGRRTRGCTRCAGCRSGARSKTRSDPVTQAIDLGGDLPAGRIGRAGARASVRVLRAIDLAGKPLSAQRGRPDDPQRPARAGHCAVHAGNGERARPVRSVRSGGGAAEIGGVPRGVARQFGNLGLAAAAYNAGPRRVRDWLDGRSGLPAETRNYVITITGRSADEWAAASRAAAATRSRSPGNCGELMAMLHDQPSPFVTALERRVGEGAARPWGVELSAGFARDRVLAVRQRREVLSRAARKSRSDHHREQVPQPRHADLLPGACRRRHARRAPTSCAACSAKAGGACLVLRNWVTEAAVAARGGAVPRLAGLPDDPEPPDSRGSLCNIDRAGFFIARTNRARPV